MSREQKQESGWQRFFLNEFREIVSHLLSVPRSGTFAHGEVSAEPASFFSAHLCASASLRLIFIPWFRVCVLCAFFLSALAPQRLSASSPDKSGVTPNTISVPKGPGSVSGLGESFQPTLHDGAAKYAVSLSVPPGTAGQTPALSLTYHAGSGNGSVGFGWDVPVPYVQRQTDKGIPLYVDGSNGLDDDSDGEVDEPDELDTFINDAKEELVPLANGDFFCKNESAFVRYRRTGDHWEGNLPDGTTLFFGLTSAGRVADASTGHVFKWLLEEEVDVHGNTIRYLYASKPVSVLLFSHF